MIRKNGRKDKNMKIIRKSSIFASLIVISVLSYKGYECYQNKIVQANRGIASTKIVTKNNIKEEIVNNEKKKNIKEDNLKDILSNVNSEGRKYTYDVKEVKNILDNKQKSDGKKIAFLTFDDGPSITVTPKILDILKNYNIKATFCLVGKNIDTNERSRNLVNRTFKEGHALANHTYSHNLKNLYPKNKINVEYFMEEIEENNAAIRNIVGQDFNTRVLRMPGGYMSREYYKDPNLSELNARLKEKDMYSIDWNAYDFDSEGNKKNAAELLNEVKKSVGSKEKVIILMHDTYGKEETAKALPKIIEYLKGQGYEFRTMS
ncbi:polysaccharide deacetylase [Clostridiaceae bacterium UIB06]|uniref:Polysaccharide deacetylase n=1 Tax=Clostridium thailandense TaxID=2794346 RepID=A0A949WTU2_9CLOT|nr:polysaccharide deacetylase family protein [Clostridium thailandense]MBV7276591.1 polysaccharide deacetylase [Clostridium thailandense]MCH5136120.1 polysaccharide deacetylase [Clostridiaceae bacterium UIB06]